MRLAKAPCTDDGPFAYESGTRRCYFDCQLGQNEAIVVEQWDDRLYDQNGSQVRVEPPRVEQRYLIERVSQNGHPCDFCWMMVESELRRGT